MGAMACSSLRSSRSAALVALALAAAPLGCSDDGSVTDDEASDTAGEDTEESTGDGEDSESSDTGEATTESSDSTDSTDTTDTGEADPQCAALAPGLNSGFMVDGLAREFYLDLPADVEAGGPWPVVFSWHGLGDTAANFRGLFSGLVDNPAMPFILVTPEDTDFPISAFGASFPMDWDTFMIEPNGAGNREVALFDAVLECVDQRWGLDASHVHSTGFSLGSITTDMISTVRGEQLASVATYSGGYWSNPSNVDALLGIVANWPPHAVQNKYPQLLVHGGATDTIELVPGVYTMDFSAFAVNDQSFLINKGHPVVTCDHGAGHTAPVSVSPTTVIEFFALHPLGTTDSPWAGSPPAELDFCEFDL